MIVIVTDEAGAPVPVQALVKLYSETGRGQIWGITSKKKSQAEFDAVIPGDYEVQASAAGYETATQSLDVTSGSQMRVVPMRLRGNGDMEAGQLLRPVVMKQVQKGLSAMNAGRWEAAQKDFEAACRLAPENADVNFLLGFLFEERKDAGRAESYFVKAISADPQDVHALTALGQLRENQGDYTGAVAPLEKAASIDDEHWLAHWLLASAYFQEQQFPKARDEAASAIRTGKGAGNGAEFIHGLALERLGHRDEAIAAFDAFLRNEPQDPAAPAVRQALAQLQSRASDSGGAKNSVPVRALSPRKYGCK